jgi:hypothetical protein
MEEQLCRMKNVILIGKKLFTEHVGSSINDGTQFLTASPSIIMLYRAKDSMLLSQNI